MPVAHQRMATVGLLAVPIQQSSADAVWAVCQFPRLKTCAGVVEERKACPGGVGRGNSAHRHSSIKTLDIAA